MSVKKTVIFLSLGVHDKVCMFLAPDVHVFRTVIECAQFQRDDFSLLLSFLSLFTHQQGIFFSAPQVLSMLQMITSRYVTIALNFIEL